MACVGETVAVLHEVDHLHSIEILCDGARKRGAVFVDHSRRHLRRQPILHEICEEKETEERQNEEGRPVDGPSHNLEHAPYKYGFESCRAHNSNF